MWRNRCKCYLELRWRFLHDACHFAIQFVSDDGMLVEFFGAPARLPDGHVRLAMRAGVPLILGFSQRLGRDSYRARFWPHYAIPEEGSENERLAAGMNYVVRGLEETIRAHPEQWAVTVPIWGDDVTKPSSGG